MKRLCKIKFTQKYFILRFYFLKTCLFTAHLYKYMYYIEPCPEIQIYLFIKIKGRMHYFNLF